ncbi:MAG: NUDIX hydrolase [Alphaproteobacteria bacterium]|nr:NUDIX hydrolase [Alphaproteobacteria bacterium]
MTQENQQIQAYCIITTEEITQQGVERMILVATRPVREFFYGNDVLNPPNGNLVRPNRCRGLCIFPGGRGENDTETGSLQTAIDEFYEETGINIAPLINGNWEAQRFVEGQNVYWGVHITLHPEIFWHLVHEVALNLEETAMVRAEIQADQGQYTTMEHYRTRYPGTPRDNELAEIGVYNIDNNWDTLINNFQQSNWQSWYLNIIHSFFLHEGKQITGEESRRSISNNRNNMLALWFILDSGDGRFMTARAKSTSFWYEKEIEQYGNITSYSHGAFELPHADISTSAEIEKIDLKKYAKEAFENMMGFFTCDILDIPKEDIYNPSAQNAFVRIKARTAKDFEDFYYHIVKQITLFFDMDTKIFSGEIQTYQQLLKACPSGVPSTDWVLDVICVHTKGEDYKDFINTILDKRQDLKDAVMYFYGDGNS